MKRIHLTILYGQVLSYCLLVTFLFADMTFNLTSAFRTDSTAITPQTAYIGACLIMLVGAINVWLTWHYFSKSNAMRDWLVICAWTNRVKVGRNWVNMEEFLHQHLGYEVSHGLSEPALMDMRGELDDKWLEIRDRQLRDMKLSDEGESPHTAQA